MLSAKELKNLISYDPGTGVFERKIKTSANAGSGGLNKHGYIVISIASKPYYAHRLAWLYMTGEWPKGQIDHINGIRHDNRFSNIRDVSARKNQQNLNTAQKNNTTGYLGVMYMGDKRRGKKYSAAIYRDGKSKALGYYHTPEDAHKAYMAAKREYEEQNA